MTDRTSFETVADGDVLKEGYFNGCYDTVTDTSTGHDHDGVDSKGIGRWVRIIGGSIPTGSGTATLASSISSSYTQFQVILNGVGTSTANRTINLVLNSDTTTSHYPATNTANTGAAVNASANTANGLVIGNNATNILHAMINISNYNGTGKAINIASYTPTNSTNVIGYFTVTAQITTIALTNNAGENFTSGTYEVYGFINY